MEMINLLEIALLTAVISVMTVSAGALICRLINRSGPGTTMWHDCS